MKYLFTLFALFTSIIICAAVLYGEQGDIENKIEKQYVISGRGLIGIVEIGMDLQDLENMGFVYEKMVFISEEFEKEYDLPEEERHYDIDSLGIEFQIKQNKIIRLWFETDKNPLFKIFLPKDNELRKLGDVSASDIIRNFGPVNKYINEKPPEKKEAQWAKYSPLGVFYNSILYPDLPFSFGLTEDDILKYVTVSDAEFEKAD